MADSAYKQFFWILVASCVVSTGSLLAWIINKTASDTAVATKLDNLTAKVSELSDTVKTGTAARYTSFDAAKDREAYLGLIGQSIDLSKHNTAAIDAMRVAMDEFRVFKAKAEERMGAKP